MARRREVVPGVNPSTMVHVGIFQEGMPKSSVAGRAQPKERCSGCRREAGDALCWPCGAQLPQGMSENAISLWAGPAPHGHRPL